jgi:hypothetical protein
MVLLDDCLQGMALPHWLVLVDEIAYAAHPG